MLYIYFKNLPSDDEWIEYEHGCNSKVDDFTNGWIQGFINCEDSDFCKLDL